MRESLTKHADDCVLATKAGLVRALHISHSRCQCAHDGSAQVPKKAEKSGTSAPDAYHDCRTTAVTIQSDASDPPENARAH